MPRVNIHEVDNTKPGTRAYQNFTVVVPGFHAPYVSRTLNETVREEIGGIVLDKEVTDKVTGVKSYPPLTDAEVFGDENILEIKTQADFEQYIGFVKPIAYNEGYKANVISREILAEDVYNDPSQILYYDGNEKAFPIDTKFVVEQNKEEDTITFIYRWDANNDGEITDLDGDGVVDAEKDDQAFSEKYDREEKVVYKYSINGFDVSLFKKPLQPKIGVAPFVDAKGEDAILGKDYKCTKDANGDRCTSKGELFAKFTTETAKFDKVEYKHLSVTDADGNFLYEYRYTETTNEDGSRNFEPIVEMAPAADYDLENPIDATEAYVLLDDEQKIHEAGCYFERCDVAGGEFKVQKYQWCTDVRLPAHYGNQIAYELLGLGYTIYYVNMGAWNPTEEATGEAKVDNRGYIQYVQTTVDQLTTEEKKAGYTVDADGFKLDPYGYKVPELEDEAVNVGMKKIDKAYKALGSEDFWAPLRDKTTYDFRFVLTGFIEEGNFTSGGYRDYMKNANFEIAKLAAWEAPGEDAFAHVRARGDCLALIDLDEDNIAYNFASTASGQGNTTKRLVKAIQQDIRRQNFGIYGKYSAIFTPSVTYANNLKQDVYQNCKFPASFHYLACFAKSVFADNYKEWFAVAGFTRGLSTYNIDSVGFNLGDVAMNALEPRFFVNGSPVNVAVNVIVNNRGSYYIWGNRTCHTLGEELTASHFLNIRQLCITLKKFIYVLCRKFTFDPNSDVLWANFIAGLTPCLENMKANQGIRDYAIEKEYTNLKGVLKARVRIVPIEAVEDFEITVALEDSLDGAVVGE